MMKMKFRPVISEITLTFIAETAVLIGFIFAFRLVATNFGPVGIGKYSLVKKVASFIQPLLILGLGIGIPRYIAISKTDAQRAAYIKAGFFTISICTVSFLVLINAFKEYFAKIFFGNILYAGLVFPFTFFLAGLIMHVMVYSYLRGYLFVKVFNMLQIINLFLIPVFVIFFLRYLAIEKIILYIGIYTFMISAVFAFLFLRNSFVYTGKEQFFGSLKELFRYSLPRTPADFALTGIFSLSVIFAAHISSIEEVGYLSVSQSLLAGVCGMVAPLGIILLPRISRLTGDNAHETVNKNINLLISAVLQYSIFACAQLLIFSDSIIRYWLGPNFAGTVPVMQITLVSVVFYTFYVAIRSILDAVEVKPLNTINIFISLFVFLVTTGLLLFFRLFPAIINLSIAFDAGLVSLGILTYISVRKIYRQDPKMDLNCLVTGVAVNLILGIAALLVKNNAVLEFYQVIILEIFLISAYMLILWALKVEWVREIPGRIYNKERGLVNK